MGSETAQDGSRTGGSPNLKKFFGKLTGRTETSTGGTYIY